MYHNELQYEGLTNVWLTPRWLIDAIGPFELDPCAADPRPFDIAPRNITQAQNGLDTAWEDGEGHKPFVFCNPPYGPNTGLWLARMAEHDHGIALVFARTETKAMQRALRDCDAVFFFNKRITFLRGEPPHEQGPTSGGAPSCLLAYGPEAYGRLVRSPLARHGQTFIRLPHLHGL